jgi:hypothetical protein
LFSASVETPKLRQNREIRNLCTRSFKPAHEILDFVEQCRADLPPAENVSKAILKRFGVSINPRSIDRALVRRKKKR